MARYLKTVLNQFVDWFLFGHMKVKEGKSKKYSFFHVRFTGQ